MSKNNNVFEPYVIDWWALNLRDCKAAWNFFIKQKIFGDWKRRRRRRYEPVTRENEYSTNYDLQFKYFILFYKIFWVEKNGMYNNVKKLWVYEIITSNLLLYSLILFYYFCILCFEKFISSIKLKSQTIYKTTSLYTVNYKPKETTYKSKGNYKQMLFNSKTKFLFIVIHSFSNKTMITMVCLHFKQMGMSCGCYSMVVEIKKKKKTNGLKN